MDGLYVLIYTLKKTLVTTTILFYQHSKQSYASTKNNLLWYCMHKLVSCYPCVHDPPVESVSDVVCVVREESRQRIHLPCVGVPVKAQPGQQLGVVEAEEVLGGRFAEIRFHTVQ